MVEKVQRITDVLESDEDMREYLTYDEVPPETRTNLFNKVKNVQENLSHSEKLNQHSIEIMDNLIEMAEPYWKQSVYTKMPPDLMEETLIGEFAYEAHNYLESNGVDRQNSAKLIDAVIREDFNYRVRE